VIGLRRSLVFSSVAWIFLTHSLSAGDSHQKRELVSVDLRFEYKDRTNPVLHVTMKNNSTNVLIIEPGHFPWDRYAMSMAVVESEPGSSPLREMQVIADSRLAAPHTIATNQIVRGEVLLNNRYPDLLKTLKRSDVLLFWSYKCPSKTFEVERVGGWCLLEQPK